MEQEKLTLPVKGMHCASCVSKVEAALAGVPGVVQASVNLATEKATVALIPGHVTVADLRTAVRAAGYEIPEVIPTEAEAPDRERAERERENRLLRLKFLVGAALTLPVLLGSFPQLFPWMPAVFRSPWV